jgi:hypothetical protein
MEKTTKKAILLTPFKIKIKIHLIMKNNRKSIIIKINRTPVGEAVV